MFGIKFETVFMPKSWETANRHYERTPAYHRGEWRDNERPLRDNRAHHLRMQKNEDESFSLILYRHTMIRFYKPTTHKYEVAVFMPWGGNANWNFIWHCGYGWGTRHPAMRREETVWLHPYPSSEPDSKAAHLVFKRKTRNDEFKLDTKESWQLQAYRWKYLGTERKSNRALMRDKLRSLVILLSIAQNTYEPAYNARYARVFKHRREAPKEQLADGYMERRAVLSTLRQYALGEVQELTPEASAGLVKWFERTLDVRCSQGKDDGPLTDAQIEASLVRLLDASKDGEYERVKVPVQMWRSGGNRPSRTQSFSTRAEAERAYEKLKQLKSAVDEVA